MVDYGRIRSTVRPEAQVIDEFSVWVNTNIEEITIEQDGVSRTEFEFNQIQYDKDEFIFEMSKKVSIIQTYRKQSDKLGYDWEVTKVGDLEAMKVYVPQENPVGTSADNPIIWKEDSPLIDNAFYLKPDDKIYVYMVGEWVEWQNNAQGV